MPFIALASPKGNPNKKERVAIYNYKNPRSELSSDKYDLTCPLCGERMSVRQQAGVVAHFWHPEGCTGASEGESIEHEIGKDAIRDYLQKSPLYKGAQIDFEHWFPDVRRRADVYVKLADGGIEVHEIQLAAITPDELEKRTRDYFLAGVNDVHWWLGGNANNERNQKWCKDFFGYVSFANIETFESSDVVVNHTYRASIN